MNSRSKIHALVDALIELRMFTEATLDFPDEDIEFLRAGDVVAKLAAIRATLAQVLARAQTGALLREGLTVVLVGSPERRQVEPAQRARRARKPRSSRRWRARRATRWSGSVEIAGIPLTVVDTAGLRDTADPVEAIGIERTWAAVERADLVLLIGRCARWCGRARCAKTGESWRACRQALPRVVVHNKADLAHIAPTSALRDESRRRSRRHVWLSAPTSAPASTCWRREVLAVVGAQGHDRRYVPRPRARTSRVARRASAIWPRRPRSSRSTPPPIELFAEELREAQSALSAITGEFTADDLLGVIFGRFCIGK